MAKLIESTTVIKISKLAKDNEVIPEIMDQEKLDQLESVLRELVDDPQVLIEIQPDHDESHQ